MAPKLVVAMPLFNEELYVKQAIISIQQQTFTDFKLIVLDDGSTDSSRQIVRQALSSDSRIELRQNDTNMGNLKCFLDLIKYSSEEFFCWIGSHDIIETDYLKILVSELEQNRNLNYSYGHYVYIDESSNEVGRSPKPNLPEHFFMLSRLHRFFFSIGMSRSNSIHFNGIYRSSILRGFGERHQSSIIGWDHVVSSLAFYHGASFKQEAEYKQRVFENRISTTYTRVVGVESVLAKLRPSILHLIRSYLREYWNLPESKYRKITMFPTFIFLLKHRYSVKLCRDIYWEGINIFNILINKVRR
jgi:glycosyltransferase involved in cell wall biosynthesis